MIDDLCLKNISVVSITEVQAKSSLAIEYRKNYFLKQIDFFLREASFDVNCFVNW